MLFAAVLWAARGARAQTNYAQPPAIDDAAPMQGAERAAGHFSRMLSLDQKLGDAIPLDLTFRDEHGQPVVLRSFFGSKPVILTLVYYSCPMLCTQVLNAVTRSVKLISLNMGDDYEIVTVSIDPSERPVLAEAKHAALCRDVRAAGRGDGLAFFDRGRGADQATRGGGGISLCVRCRRRSSSRIRAGSWC